MDAGWTSTIPDTMAALVQLWTDALPGVQVADGPWVGNDGNYSAVSVGYDGNDGAVNSETTASGAGLRENYTIFCSICVVMGDDGTSGFAAVRTQAFNLLATCTEALDADWTLGDKVLRAMPGAASIHQAAGDFGRRVIIAFGVQVDAFTKEAA